MIYSDKKVQKKEGSKNCPYPVLIPGSARLAARGRFFSLSLQDNQELFMCVILCQGRETWSGFLCVPMTDVMVSAVLRKHLLPLFAGLVLNYKVNVQLQCPPLN